MDLLQQAITAECDGSSDIGVTSHKSSDVGEKSDKGQSEAIERPEDVATDKADLREISDTDEMMVKIAMTALTTALLKVPYENEERECNRLPVFIRI